MKPLFIISILFFKFTAFLYAQQLYIPYIENVQVDGKKNEWQKKKPLLLFTHDNPIKKNANTAKVFVGWNQLYLFILFIVEDKNLISLTNDSNKVHLNDAIEFFIDPYADSKDKMDVNDYQFIVDVNGMVAILKGDHRKTDSIDIIAPKTHGLTTLVFKSATQVLGTINKSDIDTGYQVEMAIPFSAIGIEPKEGIFFNADFCMDDADSLVDIVPIPDSLEIPSMYYSNWQGITNFSFPTNWTKFTLKGKPTWLSKFVKANAVTLWWAVIFIAIIASIVIALLIYRIQQLKNVPKKSTIQHFEQIQQYIVGNTSINNIEEIAPSQILEEEIIKEQIIDEQLIVEPIIKVTEEPHVIKKARNYIMQHIEDEIEIEKLASACAVSSRQLQRIFKEHLAITPSGFIVILKMEEAEKLLRSGKYNVTEVAYHLGYSEAAYFTRVFKKYFGYPPKYTLA